MANLANHPDETSVAIVDGWLRAGDLGMVDDRGHILLVDRTSEVAVVPGPHGLLGEVPATYVALQHGSETTVDSIMARCAAELARYNLPKRIVVLAELPKGPTGQILRRALKAEAEADALMAI